MVYLLYTSGTCPVLPARVDKGSRDPHETGALVKGN